MNNAQDLCDMLTDEGLRDAAENHLAGAMPFSIDILSVENYDVVEETLEA